MTPAQLALYSALVLLGASVLLLIAIYTWSTGIGPTPSSARARTLMLDQLPAACGGVIYELGSGWGGLARALARRFPEATVIGCELSPVPWLGAALWQTVCPLPNLLLRRVDFRDVSLKDADAVVCYLSPSLMADLSDKLRTELPMGACVISLAFALPRWQADAEKQMEDLLSTSVYVYRV